MNNLITSSSPDTTTLAVPELRDDGSNWSDYEPHIQTAMGPRVYGDMYQEMPLRQYLML